MFNEVIAGPKPRSGDGRTERRRKRLLAELERGTTQKGADLKPIDVLLRAQALLDLGELFEVISAARKVPPPVKATDELVEGVRDLHSAYTFAAEVYTLVGIEDDVLRRAGVLAGKREARALAEQHGRPALVRGGAIRARQGAPGPAKTKGRSSTARRGAA